MYEELSPMVGNCGLYDGLASLLGKFFNQVNDLQPNLIATELQVALVNDCVELLRRDNKCFNEARFRQNIARWQDVPRETIQRGTIYK